MIKIIRIEKIVAIRVFDSDSNICHEQCPFLSVDTSMIAQIEKCSFFDMNLVKYIRGKGYMRLQECINAEISEGE